MSQEKVNQKKEQKKNIKSTVKKRKFEYVVSIVAAVAVAVCVLGWIGFSIYSKVSATALENKVYDYYDISTDAIQEYLGNLN